MALTQQQYKLFATLTAERNGGPVNCLLFIRSGTLLISGGDDQIVRTWDIPGRKHVQKLHDQRWGQITALSWSTDTSMLFIGTGRGVVSLYPFSNEQSQFIAQKSATVAVFKLNDSIEVQALDSSSARFAVASHSGHIRMFGIKDTTSLFPLWTFQVQDIPRSIFFLGNYGEGLVVHTCCLGEVIYSNSSTGELIGKARLRGGIGSAALSADGSSKAVYNLSSGHFDLYRPPDSLTPITLPVTTTTRLIKQCIFAEENSCTLVCGGDNGTVDIFQLDGVPQSESLQTGGIDTFYATTVASTSDYHLIACGGSQDIFIWRKPTKTTAARNQNFQCVRAENAGALSKQSAEDVKTTEKTDILDQRRTASLGEKLLLSSGLFFVLSVVLTSMFWLAYHYR